MTDYRFYIDGDLSFTGIFDPQSVNDSFVNFGDGTQGVASTARWDYFRFGVVPEPSCVGLLILVAGLMLDRPIPKTRRGN